VPGVNSALFNPPPQVYMMESHLRGVAGHAVDGVVLGAMLAVASRLRAPGRTSELPEVITRRTHRKPITASASRGVLADLTLFERSQHD
jgi:hypothetical protein